MAWPTIGQSAIGSNGNSVFTATRAAVFAGSVTAGTWLVAAIRVGSQDADAGTVTDTRGNTYTLQQASVVSGTTKVAIFLAPSGSSGANTVTYTLASGTAVMSLAVAEVAVVTGGASIVKHTSAGGAGTSATMTGTSLVTTADTLMLACLWGLAATETWAATGGFTQIQTTVFASVSASLIAKSAAAGTHTPGWSNSASHPYEIASIALAESAPAAVATAQPYVWGPL